LRVRAAVPGLPRSFTTGREWRKPDNVLEAPYQMLSSQVRQDVGRAEASNLTGVAETTLLTLGWRAEAAKRARAKFNDPLAVEAASRFGGDLAKRFGKPTFGPAIRAKWSDSLIVEFLARNPRALVLALGEGLETQFWRVDNGLVEWRSVDLPEVLALRREILPPHERNILIEGSVTDPRWLETIAADRPTLITAHGLLMYLERPDVAQLLQNLAAKFGRADILFDTVPEWTSHQTTTTGMTLNRIYPLPPMPFGAGIADLGKLCQDAPALRIKSARSYGEVFPSLTPLLSLLSRWPHFRNKLSPALIHAELDHERAIAASRAREASF
jgi:hypothetical protein